MDRKIVYPGQIPLETDLLGTNQSTMVALSKLAAAILGTGGVVSGLAVGPNTPAALNVVVSPGEIYSLQNLEATPYSSLPADTSHTCVKQGILLDAVTLPCPAPTTAGFSINYLIEAAYADADVNPTTLPYYNASNPSQAYSGPNNTGAAQATTRAGQVQLQVKAGVAAATGSQTTPAVDVGFIALAVVTVANGQTTIVAGNISANVTGSVMPKSVREQIYTGRKATFATSGSFVVPYGVTTIYVTATAAGGGGGGGCGSAASQVNWPATGGGGGSGQSVIAQAFNVTPGQVIPITIGGKGLGGSGGGAGAAGTNGTAGGNTVIGSLLTLSGGGPGTGGTSPTGTGGAGNGGAGFPCKGSPGSQGGSSGQGGTGASSRLGGGGGGGQPIATNVISGAIGGVGDIGGGGGGGGTTIVSSTAGGAAGNGGDGFALIEW